MSASVPSFDPVAALWPVPAFFRTRFLSAEERKERDRLRKVAEFEAVKDARVDFGRTLAVFRAEGHRSYDAALGVEVRKFLSRGTMAAVMPAPLPVPEPGKLREEGILNGSQKRTAFALRMNAEEMIRSAGIHCIGFLTLTVGDYKPCGWANCKGCKRGKHFVKVTEMAEASRRFNNLNRRLLKEIFECAIVVTERHKDGGIHYHLLGVIRGRPDIRTGFNFNEVAMGSVLQRQGKPYKHCYRSACEDLRALWNMMRKKLPEYGFGRQELMPVKKCGKAVSSYIAKYIEKNVCNRPESDKGKKLVRYLGFDRHLKPNEFSWGTPRACAWRIRTRQVAALAGVMEREQAAVAFGPRWANSLTGLWAGLVDDEKKRELALDWGRRVVLTAELYNLNSAWMRCQDRKRVNLGDGFAEIHDEMAWEEMEKRCAHLRQELKTPIKTRDFNIFLRNALKRNVYLKN